MEVEIKMSRKHPSSQNKNNNNERKVVSRKANKCPNSLKKTVPSVLHHIFEILGILGMVEIYCGSFESKVVCCETNRPV